jgi:hypothetical protein
MFTHSPVAGGPSMRWRVSQAIHFTFMALLLGVQIVLGG